MGAVKVLVDTNILLDMAVPGRPESYEARTVFALAAEGRIAFVHCSWRKVTSSELLAALGQLNDS